MSIKVREVTTLSDKKQFVRFQLDLYKNHPCFVPPIINDELDTFDSKKNPVFEHAEARLFLAYNQDNKIVGRIAAIVNHKESTPEGKPKMRFGWYDVIDDVEVTKALLKEVESIGREKGLLVMEGPLGFSNLDKAGLLYLGFDKIATIVTLYNHPYYLQHLEALGWETGSEWVEYEIPTPKVLPEKVLKFIDIIKRRYKVEVMRFKNKKEILDLSDQMFDLLEETYKNLPSFVPFSKNQRQHYKEKFFRFIHPDFITCIANEEGKLVAFAITMPSYSKALQKANGSLFPFGWYHLYRATKKNDSAAFYLIGIDPKLQGKGMTALIFNEMFVTFNKHKITTLETNPELVQNKNVQVLWEDYNPVMHKARRSFTKRLS